MIVLDADVLQEFLEVYCLLDMNSSLLLFEVYKVLQHIT